MMIFDSWLKRTTLIETNRHEIVLFSSILLNFLGKLMLCVWLASKLEVFYSSTLLISLFLSVLLLF